MDERASERKGRDMTETSNTPIDAEPFSFRRSGRNYRTAVVLICIYFILLALIIVVNAVWWLMAWLALPTLPALYDLIKNPQAGVDANASGISWFSGKRTASVEWDEVDYVRFDTRLDLSIRVSVVLKTGRQIRLPYESVPSDRRLEEALAALGISVRSQHFRIF